MAAFFRRNDLAAITSKAVEVFETVHATVFASTPQVDGFRVDHIDTLASRRHTAGGCANAWVSLNKYGPQEPPGRAYFIVEKILARKESIPIGWDVDGTTGYDFMDEASAFFATSAASSRSGIYGDTLAGPDHFDCEEELARRQILRSAASLLSSRQPSRLSMRLRKRRQLLSIIHDLRFVAPGKFWCIFASTGSVPALAARRQRIASSYPPQLIAPDKAVPGADTSLIAVLGQWLTGAHIKPELDQLQAVALIRFQQLTAPLCAKAVEDTAFYRYGRLLSRNDVGFDPRHFASSIADFHRSMQCREPVHTRCSQPQHTTTSVVKTYERASQC